MAIPDIFHTSSRSVFCQDTGINYSSNNNNDNNGDGQQTTQSTTSEMIDTAVTTTNIGGGGGSSVYTAATGTIQLTQLFHLLRLATSSLITLCVAGGWVRAKLLAMSQFVQHRSSNLEARNCLTSKFNTVASMGCHGTKTISQSQISSPVDIHMALDLNNHLKRQDKETASVGVVLANPEKSKRLKTVTVGLFWIDFVNV